MLPDIQSLALFAKVAEMRSITKAAESSHIALAAASRRIATLEERFGVQLLQRTSRGADLTPAGRTALYHIRQILWQMGEMRNDMTDYSKGRKGHVRLQASASAISQFLPEDVAAFAQHFPEGVISMEERLSGEIVQAVREGVTDIGVVMEGAAMEDLECQEYKVDTLVALLPRAHPLQGKRVSFSSLLEYEFVGLDSGAAISRLLSDQAAVIHRPLRVRVQAGSFATLCKMVEAGLGIGVLPEGAARPFVTGMQLRLVHLSDAWARRRMFICTRGYDTLPALARKLVDHLRARMENPAA